MTAETLLRIGDIAEQVGTTTRTIRYYEEIGLLPGSAQRASGAHRAYTEADVERLRHILRLKELLGVTLDDLKLLVEAEDARAALRAEFRDDDTNARRRHEILEQALGDLREVRRGLLEVLLQQRWLREGGSVTVQPHPFRHEWREHPRAFGVLASQALQRRPDEKGTSASTFAGAPEYDAAIASSVPLRAGELAA